MVGPLRAPDETSKRNIYKKISISDIGPRVTGILFTHAIILHINLSMVKAARLLSTLTKEKGCDNFAAVRTEVPDGCAVIPERYLRTCPGVSCRAPDCWECKVNPPCRCDRYLAES
jgi:hypothetical protein